MDREQIKTEVLNVLRWHFNDSTIFEDTELQDYGVTDLDDIELLIAIEEGLGVEIDIDPAEKAETVNDLITLIEKSL